MKRLLLCAFFVVNQWALASPFPWWFHTRPKPVLVDYQPENKPSENPAPRSIAHPAPQAKPQPKTPEHQPTKPSFVQQLFAGRSK